MAERPALRRPFELAQRERSNDVSRIIKTRNSPQSVYVRDYQRLSQPRKVNMQRDIFQTLDLAHAFKGLTIVTFTDEPDILRKPDCESEQPFQYSSTPSPCTSTDSESSHKHINDLPLPKNVVDDSVLMQDCDWDPSQPLCAPTVRKRTFSHTATQNQLHIEKYRGKRRRCVSCVTNILSNNE